MCGKLSQVCSATTDSSSVFYPAALGYGSIRGIMRRVLAAFLVAVLGLGGLIPLAVAAAGDTTPVCCRKDGKHHCQMTRAGERSSSDGQPRIQGSASDCPFHEQAGTQPPIAVGAVPPSSQMPRLAISRSILLSDFVILASDPISSGTLRGPPFLS